MNPTKAKESSYICRNCSKTYVRNSSLQKHLVFCGVGKSPKVVSKSVSQSQPPSANMPPMPSYQELCIMVHELTYKCARMEERMEQMQKWTDKQKKRIVVEDWLNANVTPNHTFKDYMRVLNAQIGQEHIELLIHATLYETIQHIFTTVENDSLYCVDQKQNQIFVYEEVKPLTSSVTPVTTTKEWRQMSRDDFISLLNYIHSKLLREIIAWEKKNHETIANNDSMSKLYHKTMIKLMSVEFTNDTVLGRIRGPLYNHLKKDLKNMMEYEFA